ncbi:hypothetical protein HKCCSP123_16775, partial [Rhodobacterales bacterium HKCCSP123]|nr:hypothetical protein [Rhodobacterales bacterium HKCCSP123]
MSSNTGGLICAAVSWGVALVVSLFAAVMLWMLGGWSFLQGAFAAVFIFLGLGALISLTVCRGPSGMVRPGTAGVEPGSAPTVPVLPERKPSRSAATPAPAAPAAAPASGMEPDMALL